MKALREELRLLRAALVMGGVLSVVAGCATPSVNDPARLGPFYQPRNYAGEAQMPADMRRVLLLPLASGQVATAESAMALDPVLLSALQRQNRFEIVPLTRADLQRLFHVDECSSAGALPADFVEVLRRQYAADGVLLVDLTVYRPYRPLAIGLRAKLANLSGETRYLWTFDNVFALSDPDVANSARHFFLQSGRPGMPGDPTLAVLESPTRFGAYVAEAMFTTLPPVRTPPPSAAETANER